MLGWEDAFIEADLDLAKENLAIHMRRWEVLAHAREIQMIAETVNARNALAIYGRKI